MQYFGFEYNKNLTAVQNVTGDYVNNFTFSFGLQSFYLQYARVDGVQFQEAANSGECAGFIRIGDQSNSFTNAATITNPVSSGIVLTGTPLVVDYHKVFNASDDGILFPRGQNVNIEMNFYGMTPGVAINFWMRFTVGLYSDGKMTQTRLPEGLTVKRSISEGLREKRIFP